MIKMKAIATQASQQPYVLTSCLSNKPARIAMMAYAVAEPNAPQIAKAYGQFLSMIRKHINGCDEL